MHQPSSAGFVGRTQELAELRAGLDDVIQGRARFFLITGEPGIGKSRLAEQVAIEAAGHNAIVAWGRCWEGGGAPAYWPWIQIFRAGLRDSGQRTSDLEPGLVADLVPEIFERRGSRVLRSRVKPSSDSEQERFRFFDSVATLLKRLSLAEPFAIFMDDLHAADETSLQMLIFVARELKSSRVLLVGTYRDNEIRNSPAIARIFADLAREARQLPLGGLSRKEVEEYLDQNAAFQFDPELIDALNQVTGGNPLFLDGIIRTLANQRAQAGDRAISAADFEIPHGVRVAIRVRLDRLSAHANSVLQIASVIGKEFDLECIRRIHRRSVAALLGSIDELSRNGIIIAAPCGELIFRFSHDLIREAIYKAMSTAEQLKLHQRVAETIEEIHKHKLTAHLAGLAYHYHIATPLGCSAKAIEYSIRAGEAALRSFAYEETARHWTTALKLMEQQAGTEKQLAEMYLRLCWLSSTIDKPTRIGYLERALKLYDKSNQPADAAKVHATLGLFLSGPSSTNIPLALEHYAKADSFQRQGVGRGFTKPLLAKIEFGRSLAALVALRTSEGLRASRHAMDLGQDLGDTALVTYATIFRSVHLAQAGTLRESRLLIDRAWEMADKLNYASSSVNITMALDASECGGAIHSSLCDLVESQRWYERELSKSRTANTQYARHGFSRLLGKVLLWRDLKRAEPFLPYMSNDPRGQSAGFIAFWEGRWEQAESYWTDTYERTRAVEDHDHSNAYTWFLAWARRLLEQHVKAEALVKQALILAGGEALQPLEMWARSEFVLLCVETNRLNEAGPHVERCREIMAGGEDWRGLAGRVMRAEAILAAADSNFGRAEADFEKAIAVFRSYGVPYEEAETFYYWGRALRAAGKYAQAVEKLEQAIGIYRRAEAGARWIQRALAAKRGGAVTDAIASCETEGRFRREDDYWAISFGGISCQLKHMKGLAYLSHLLQHPNVEFKAVDLVFAEHRPASGFTSAHLDSQETQHAIREDLGDAGVVLDPQARAEYRQRLKQLRYELDEARQFNDRGKAERLEAESDFLTAELVAAVGKNGRNRKTASHAERARLAVYKRIKFSLGEIQCANPLLAAHLTASIRTGYNCVYLPQKPVRWAF